MNDSNLAITSRNENFWEQRKLNDIAKVYDGIHETPNYTMCGIPFVSVENIKTLTTKKYVSKSFYEEKFKIKPQYDDILMTRIGDIGTSNVVSKIPLAYYVSLALIRLNTGQNAYFFKYFFDSEYAQKELWSRTLHIAFPKKINKNEIGKINIYTTCIKEENKIAQLFNKLNSLLTLYERKYQLYLLQFQKLQRVIFDNSDDFISLSYLIEIKTGNRNSQDNVKNGKYVFFDRSTEIKRLNEFDFDEEAIIIPGEGTKFAPKYVNGKYALHQRSYSLYNFSQEIDSKYLYYFLMTQSNTLLRYSVGTTVPSLRVSTFDHIKVPMYSKELQIKYALTFDSLEKLMNQIKKKTNILRSLKRFLLQVLFL